MKTCEHRNSRECADYGCDGTAPTPADVPGQGEVEEPAWVERWRGKTIAEAIFEYGAIRGDLSEQYARDQLVAILTFMMAAQIAAAEQRGREDNADHGMCYVAGSEALAARERLAGAAVLREAAADLARLDAIGQTRRDLISDEDWAWFAEHPFRDHAPHHTGDSARAATGWLRDRAERLEAGE